MAPEGNTTLSANPAANITFSDITLETAGIKTVNPNVSAWPYSSGCQPEGNTTQSANPAANITF